MSHETICKSCGKTFDDYYFCRSRKMKYCSPECYHVSKRKPNVNKHCLFCNELFSILPSQSKKRRFCSVGCAKKYWAKNHQPKLMQGYCKKCNKLFYFPKRQRNRIFCSRECTAENQRMQYKKDSKIKSPRNFRHDDKRFHRIAMEKHLGRKLSRFEHIHHIDMDCGNNKINNLYLTDIRGHGRLHKFEDIIKQLLKLKILIFRNGEYEIAQSIKGDAGQRDGSPAFGRGK